MNCCNMKFFKLKTYETAERIKEIDDRLPQDISERIQSMPGDAFDDRISENEMISYFHIDENDFYFIIDILLENSVKLEYEDITFDVLMEKYEFKDEDFEIVKKDYIKNNITLDIVLDKINLNGIKSLNDIDKEFLESFS
jgi:hypothetical protein